MDLTITSNLPSVPLDTLASPFEMESGVRTVIVMNHLGRVGASPMVKSQHFRESHTVTRRQGSRYTFQENAFRGRRTRFLDFRNTNLHWLGLTAFIFMTFIVIINKAYVRSLPPVTAPHYAIAELDRRASNSTPLVDFEVSPPVDISSTNCQVTLMEYSFGNSYGHPFVGKCHSFPSFRIFTFQERANHALLNWQHSLPLKRILNPTGPRLSKYPAVK